MQNNSTCFIVASDNFLSKHCCAARSSVVQLTVMCNSTTHNPLLCSSCNSGYKNVPQCYVNTYTACLVLYVSEDSNRVFYCESDIMIQNRWFGCLCVTYG